MSQPLLDSAYLGPQLIHGEGESVAQGMDGRETEVALADIGDCL